MININTKNKRQLIDITDEVESRLRGAGIVTMFVKHTTAALTTADLDPGGTDSDYLEAIISMTPDKKWNHPHDPAHFPDHFWASVIGPGLSVPFRDGKLQIGTWQRIVLIELDGPRDREIHLSLLPTKDL